MVEWLELGQDRVWIELWKFYRSSPMLHITHQSFVDRMIARMCQRIQILDAACVLIQTWTLSIDHWVPQYLEKK